MSKLAKDLRKEGYNPTNGDSPFAENGKLWYNSYEVVCDETGMVLDGDVFRRSKNSTDNSRETYYNSGKVRLYGGFEEAYDWNQINESGY